MNEWMDGWMDEWIEGPLMQGAYDLLTEIIIDN
jgi:hypothetical protein